MGGEQTYQPLLPDEASAGLDRRRHAIHALLVLVVGVPVVLILCLPSSQREWLLRDFGPVQVTGGLFLLLAAIFAWRVYRSQPRDSAERPTIALVLFLMVILFWREAELDLALLQALGSSANRRAASPWYLAIGMGLICLAQVWDNAKGIATRTGWTFWVAGDQAPAPEEALEIGGELTLLFCVLEFAREVRARSRRTDQAAGNCMD